VDPTACIHDLNAQAAEVLGWERAELRGLPLQTAIPAGLLGVDPSLSAPKVLGRDRDLVARRKDGSEFPVEISVGPLHGAPPSHLLVVVRDIAGRKSVQAELQEQDRKLIESTELMKSVLDSSTQNSIIATDLQ
jgi:PAS domain S-box-containing protein